VQGSDFCCRTFTHFSRRMKVSVGERPRGSRTLEVFRATAEGGGGGRLASSPTPYPRDRKGQMHEDPDVEARSEASRKHITAIRGSEQCEQRGDEDIGRGSMGEQARESRYAS